MKVGSDLPTEPGVYGLLLHAKAATDIHVGALGCLTFRKGYYIYAGSARGPGGLRARLQRHLRQKKKVHWHIDRLTQQMPVIELWYVAAVGFGECGLAALCDEYEGASPVDRFGSSDCRCRSHLYHYAKKPQLQKFPWGSAMSMRKMP